MKAALDIFLNRRVLVMPQTVTVREAARALYENKVGCAIVSDRHGHMIGILTDRDLATQILGFGRPDTTLISEVMTTDIASVESTAQLDEVVAMMVKYGVRRVPVIDYSHQGNEHCVGIVTLDDLLGAGAISPNDVIAVVSSQINPPQRDGRVQAQTPHTEREYDLGNGISFLVEYI